MPRGLSQKQRTALALLAVSDRPLDATGELLPMLGDKPNESTRRSLIRALRTMEDRGLVSLSRHPSPRGGWGVVLASIRGTGYREWLTAAELTRARSQISLDG